MYSLKEIVQAQNRIRLSSLDNGIEKIISLLNNGNCVSRKSIKQQFYNIEKSFNEFADANQLEQYKSVYNKIFNTVYYYEKQFVQQKLNVRKFLKELQSTQEQFQADIKDTKKNFNDILGFNLEEYFNYFELNSDILHHNYDKNFVKKILSFKNRIIPNIEKNIYKTVWNDKVCFYENLKKILQLTNEMNQLLEKLKSKKTQELIKDRSQVTLTLYNWDTDQDYLDYTEYWKNDFIVDKFLGIAGQYIDWKYPVAYIDPNIGELTRHIISGDPFYVIDDRTMPYENILESLPNESRGKILHYNKKTALSHLEKASIGVCISWNNFPFITQGNIYKEIQLISELLKPGGYAIFNYADAHSTQGAEFVEKNIVPVIWKERIDRYTQEFDLIEIDTNFYAGYPFTVSVYQKIGKTPELSLINKLGLVLPDQKQLNQKRLEQSEESLKIRAARSKLEQDLKRLQERDQLLRELDEKRQLGKENVLELKLQQALNHLSAMITAYDDYTHPSVLESLLHVSKITYSLGRVKDSKNLIKRVERDIAKMSADNFIARNYREWQDFLNNIDT